VAWEARGDWGPYYTRSTKRGGKITREYCGRDLEAELLAMIDARERQEREEELARRRAARAADEELDAMLAEFCDLAEAAAHAELMEAGYHFHRGRWRKRRGRHE